MDLRSKVAYMRMPGGIFVYLPTTEQMTQIPKISMFSSQNNLLPFGTRKGIFESLPKCHALLSHILLPLNKEHIE